VSDAQDVGAVSALECVDETLKGSKRMNLLGGNAIALHGLLQNAVAVAFSNALFHMLRPCDL